VRVCTDKEIVECLLGKQLDASGSSFGQNINVVVSSCVYVMCAMCVRCSHKCNGCGSEGVCVCVCVCVRKCDYGGGDVSKPSHLTQQNIR
jgi:hypothetical protein